MSLPLKTRLTLDANTSSSSRTLPRTLSIVGAGGDLPAATALAAASTSSSPAFSMAAGSYRSRLAKMASQANEVLQADHLERFDPGRLTRSL
jgi:hypothetical protein